MKSKGSKILNSNSYTNGIKETMHWINMSDLDNHKLFPTFLKENLEVIKSKEILHIVTDEQLA